MFGSIASRNASLHRHKKGKRGRVASTGMACTVEHLPFVGSGTFQYIKASGGSDGMRKVGRAAPNAHLCCSCGGVCPSIACQSGLEASVAASITAREEERSRVNW